MNATSSLPPLRSADDISSLSDAQEKILSLVPILPAILSILGSSQIIYMVLSSPKRTPYRRILLGLSCCDILSSAVFPLQAFLLPQETSQRVWAIGTDATCSFLGFAQQVSFSNHWYNAMLSIFFCMTIRYNIRDETFARRYEPWMHVCSIGYPLVTAIIGAIMGVYHETDVGLGCFIKGYPEGCGSDPWDTGPCLSPLIAWIFGGIPLVIFLCTIIVNNLLVFSHVRSTIRRAGRHCRSTAIVVGSRLAPASTLSPSSRLPSTHMGQTTTTTITTSASNNADAATRSSLFARSSLFRFHPRSSSHRSLSSSSTLTDSQVKRIRAVATQAFLYVGAFFLAYTPTMALRIMESIGFDAVDEDRLFPLLLAQNILLPMQGLFNVFIYARPSYHRARKDFPAETKRWYLRRALYGDRIQPTKTQRQGAAQYLHTISSQKNQDSTNHPSSGEDVSSRMGLNGEMPAGAIEKRHGQISNVANDPLDNSPQENQLINMVIVEESENAGTEREQDEPHNDTAAGTDDVALQTEYATEE